MLHHRNMIWKLGSQVTMTGVNSFLAQIAQTISQEHLNVVTTCKVQMRNCIVTCSTVLCVLLKELCVALWKITRQKKE